jgi:hypothetical protein
VAAGAAASDEGLVLVLVHNLDECSHSISASDADPTGANQTGAKTGPIPRSDLGIVDRSSLLSSGTARFNVPGALTGATIPRWGNGMPHRPLN